MKFCNKKKEYRKTWTIIDGPPFYLKEPAKQWCQQNPSNGRFYFGIPIFDYSAGNKELHRIENWPWYFENSQDALAFKIVWQNRRTR
jgi:hypothetical protein